MLCIVLPSTYLHTAHRVESIAELNKIVLYPKDLIINFSIVSNIARDSVQYTLNQWLKLEIKQRIYFGISSDYNNNKSFDQ